MRNYSVHLSREIKLFYNSIPYEQTMMKNKVINYGNLKEVKKKQILRLWH